MNKKGGRPTKFTDEMKDSIKFLAEKGFIEAEICTALHIDPSTLTEWKQKSPEFSISLKQWKQGPDDEVKAALFKRATGFISVAARKYFPPETLACIFWLCNRKPEEWKRKREVSIKDDRPKGPEIIRLPPIQEKPKEKDKVH